MAVISLTNVDDTLHRAIRRAALDSGETARDYILRTLAVSVGEAYAPPIASQSPAKVLAAAIPGVSTADAMPARPPHDPATCRVYRCGMCPPKPSKKRK